MTAVAAARLCLLLALCAAAACEARAGSLLPGHSRRHLLQATQASASDTAGTVVVTNGPEFVSALLKPDARLILLAGQLLQLPSRCCVAICITMFDPETRWAVDCLDPGTKN